MLRKLEARVMILVEAPETASDAELVRLILGGETSGETVHGHYERTAVVADCPSPEQVAKVIGQAIGFQCVGRTTKGFVLRLYPKMKLEGSALAQLLRSQPLRVVMNHSNILEVEYE